MQLLISVLQISPIGLEHFILAEEDLCAYQGRYKQLGVLILASLGRLFGLMFLGFSRLIGVV